MAAGDKRKRVTAVGANAPAEAPQEGSDLAARYAKLVDLRESQPERALQDYMRGARDEVDKLKGKCDAREATIALLEEKLRRLGAGEAASSPSAALEVVAAGKGKEIGGEGGNKRRMAGKRGGAVVAGANKAAVPAPVPAPGAANAPGRGAAADANASAVASVQPTPGHAASSIDATTLKLLQILSGAVPNGVTTDDDGLACHEFTVSNPAGDRHVKFSLAFTDDETEDPNGGITYEPLDVHLPGAPADLVLRDGLDFDARHAPALLREILAHVQTEKNTKRAMSSAKKSTRKSAAKP
jgi:hypothetical protein